MKHAFTIDLEEYFHAANLEPFYPPNKWYTLESRVEQATEEILGLCAEFKYKITFFVLGQTAFRHQNLIRKIHELGHEVASHGYAHRIAYQQSSKAFLRDVIRSKRLLEQIIGVEVCGYRAPNFSIRDQNLYCYDRLIEAGYLYDSSLYPVYHPRYNNRGKSRLPHYLERPKGRLFEIPLATFPIGKNNFPIAGGGYWRLFPELLISKAIARLKEPGCFYLHPWEVDGNQPIPIGISKKIRVRHYRNSGIMLERLKRYFKLFNFSTISEVYGKLYIP